MQTRAKYTFHQKGFAHFGLLLLLVIVAAVVVFVGIQVVRRHQATTTGGCGGDYDATANLKRR